MARAAGSRLGLITSVRAEFDSRARNQLLLLRVDPILAWDHDVAADLRRVCEESAGELSVERLRESLVSGRTALWLVRSSGRYAGAVVSERGERSLNLVAVRLRYNDGVLGSVLRFFAGEARESGLGLTASSRRPGMARLLARHGWRPRFVEYTAPLSTDLAVANRARVPDLTAPLDAGGHVALDALEMAMISGGKPVELPVVHRFTPGLYVREIFMPAGTLLTSKIHKTEHPFVVTAGRVRVLIPGEGVEEFTSGHVGITKPGTRRLLFIVEDTTWLTFHPLAERESGPADLPAIEERIIERRELPDGRSAFEHYHELLTGENLQPQLDYGGAP